MSVRVARIGKPHGVRGEVTVELFTDDPQSRFAPGSVLSVQQARGGRRGQGADRPEPLRVESLTVGGHRWNKDVLVARFEEIRDRNAAEAARGLELHAEVADLPLEDDEWHQDDLLGLVAVDLTRDEARIGTVKALVGGKPLAGGNREIDSPFPGGAAVTGKIRQYLHDSESTGVSVIGEHPAHQCQGYAVFAGHAGYQRRNLAVEGRAVETAFTGDYQIGCGNGVLESGQLGDSLCSRYQSGTPAPQSHSQSPGRSRPGGCRVTADEITQVFQGDIGVTDIPLSQPLLRAEDTGRTPRPGEGIGDIA